MQNPYTLKKEDILLYCAYMLRSFTPAELRTFAVVEFMELKWSESDVSRFISRWAEGGIVRNTEEGKRSPRYEWTGLLQAAQAPGWRRDPYNVPGIHIVNDPLEPFEWTEERRQRLAERAHLLG